VSEILENQTAAQPEVSMRENTLAAILNTGGTAYGGWCSAGSPVIAELIAHQNFDYMVLDVQHGLFDYASVVSAVQAIDATGKSTIIRVPSGDPGFIGKVLDGGAHGVIVPMIESEDAARRAVEACTFPPGGTRSFGPIRASLSFGRDPNVLGTSVSCIVMVETKAGVDNIDAIVGVPGVAGVLIGPGDLAVSLGLAPSFTFHEGAHEEAIQHVLSRCKQANVPVGVNCSDASSARQRASMGFRFVGIGSDLQWVVEQAKAGADGIRE
jgi:4-hydroxy-2-oxoheptanedioate aldolase